MYVRMALCSVYNVTLFMHNEYIAFPALGTTIIQLLCVLKDVWKGS